ncbi:MAG: hypothetical protein KAT04_13990 [Methylococcales bacterium]|nr:hypothetical protein [Methylococcales bacterium]
MRFLFLLSLLINVVFFLWEFNSGKLNPQPDKIKASHHVEKQILLVSELQSKENKVEFVDEVKVKQQNITSSYEGIETEPEIEVFKTDNKADESHKTEEKVKAEIVLKQNIQQDLLPLETIENNLEIDTPADEEEDEYFILDAVDQALANIGLFDNDIYEDELKKSFCYQVGSFEDKKTLDKWWEQNKIDTASMAMVNVDREKSTRYIVYYPAEKSYKKSKKNVQIFKEKGVKDFLLIRSGRLKGAISLGVFSKKKGALYIKAKLAKKKLKVIIEERHKIISDLYAKIKTSDESFKTNVVISDKQQMTDCVIETDFMNN